MVVLDAALDSRLAPTSDCCCYRASGDSLPVVRFSPEPSSITISGARSDTLSAAEVQEVGLMDIKQGWDTFCDGSYPAEVYGGRRGQEDAFRASLVSGRNPDGTNGTCPLSVDFHNQHYQLEFQETDLSDWLAGCCAICAWSLARDKACGHRVVDALHLWWFALIF